MGREIVRSEEGFKSLAKEIKKRARGGKVLLFAREDREGEDAVAALALEGFSVLRKEVDSAFVMGHIPERDRKYPEGNFVAAVGVGGLSETEAAKVFSALRNVPTVLFPTELSALSALRKEASLSTPTQLIALPAEDCIVLADRSLGASGKGIKAGLGHLLSCAAEVLDGAYEAQMRGAGDLSAVRRIFEEAFSSWRGSAPLSERIVEASLRLAELAEDLPVLRSAATLAFLAAKSAGGSYAEHLFPAAYALLSLYRAYLSDFPLEHSLPPDRAENALLIEERCRLSASAHFAQELPLFAEGYLARQRLTGEYREEVKEAIAAIPLAELCRAYRRAPEEGSAITADRLLEALSLTGEQISGYALIKHIKLTGLLEPLLLSA
ncbi:MAG: hypothetical protein J6Y74_05905 [Clostridia bacterium]|nr:hypothetical protein [Clostridia bacterium]